jgi:hypothetical protein
LEIENQKNKLIEEGMKDDKKQIDKSDEGLNRHFVDNGKGLTYSTEKTSESGVIRETYHEPRSEAEENQIVKLDKEVEKKVKSQAEKLENKEKGEPDLTQKNETQVQRRDESSKSNSN